MPKTLKYVIVGVIVLIIGFGLYTHFSKKEIVAEAVSPSGTTFSSQPLSAAEVTTVSTSTIVALTNNGNDRIINQPFCYLNSLAGVGVDNGLINIQVATSAVATGNVGSNASKNTNYLVNSSLSTTTIPSPNWFINQFGTTTAIGANVSGSALGTSTLYWASGVSIVFIADEPLAVGTSGVCGVEYLPL